MELMPQGEDFEDLEPSELKTEARPEVNIIYYVGKG